MKRSFQVPSFVGCSFVEGTSSRHTGLGSPLAVQREDIFQSKLITAFKNSLILLLFFLLHYLSSRNVSQSRYKFSPCALYNTRRPLLREKTYINFKKKNCTNLYGKQLPAFCEMMERETEICEGRRLHLRDTLLSFYH